MREETKRERFVRLAEARTNKAICMIQLLGNCSNKSSYDYSDEDVNKIFSALESELSRAKKRYSLAKEESNFSKFSLR